MKRLLIAPFMLLICSPLKADLGKAEMPAIGPKATSDITHKAWCGEVKLSNNTDCKVNFKEGRLIVDQGEGIDISQVVDVERRIICRTKVWKCTGDPSYEEMNGHKEYLIKYRSGSIIKGGQITFHDQRADQLFKKDLERWIGKPIRKVGPSIRIDIE